MEAAVLPSIVLWSHVVRAFGSKTRASFSEVSQFAAKPPLKILEYLYTAAYKLWALNSPQEVGKAYKRRGLYLWPYNRYCNKRFETRVSGANQNTIFIHNIYNKSNSFRGRLISEGFIIAVVVFVFG